MADTPRKRAGRDAEPGVRGGEMARLIILGLGAVVLLGIILTSVLSSSRPGGGEAQAPEALDPSAGGGEPRTLVFDNPDGTQTRVTVDDEEGDGQGLVNRVRPFEPDPHALEDVQDYTGMEDDEKPFYYAVHRVASLSDEEIRQRSEKNVSWTDLLRLSGKIRGRFVRIRGSLLYLKRNLLKENRSGVRNTYLGGIVGTNRKIYTFLSLRIDPRVKLGDVVELHGLYYKFWRYENRKGKNVESPYFIARSFRKIPAVPPQKPIRILGVDLVLGHHVVTWWELLAVILLAVFGPGLFLLVRYERRKFSEFKKEMAEKRKAKREKLPGRDDASGASGPPGPPSAPCEETSPAAPGDAAPAGPPAPPEGPAPPDGGDGPAAPQGPRDDGSGEDLAPDPP